MKEHDTCIRYRQVLLTAKHYSMAPFKTLLALDSNYITLSIKSV